MAGLRLQVIDGTDKLEVLVGNECVGRARPYEDVPDAYHVDFEERLPECCLQADLSVTDSRIWGVTLCDYPVSLLGRPWNARIIVSLNSNSVYYAVWPTWSQWSSVFSLGELASSLEIVGPDLGADLAKQRDSNELGFALRIEPAKFLLGRLINTCTEAVVKLFDAAFQYAATNNPRAVVGVFRFPASVASACEQYLIHFVDFLRDVGVEAHADIRHEAGRMLFTVVPEDREQSLTTIREALSIYLQLPNATLNIDTFEQEEQVIIDKLCMNVHHLKAQLAAASMMLRLQESTIAAQETAIDAQRRLLAGTPVAPERETVLPGILDVVAVEGRGVHVNLPGLVRRLKALFRRTKL